MLESFKQLEEDETKGSLDRPFTQVETNLGKCDDNVIYKCISKLLVERLLMWLPNFINGNLSTFVPGRSITDKLLFCQELVRGYHLNSRKPHCVTKVDLRRLMTLLIGTFCLVCDRTLIVFLFY